MVFSDTSTSQGIIQDITFRTNASLTDFVINDRTRLANIAYARIASIIIKADGGWRWDDTNHTDQPVSQFSLEADKGHYDILVAAPAALQNWLEIERVEILDSNDQGKLLRPINRNNIGMAISEYKDVSGVPEEYTMSGTGIDLYPAPNYDKENGATVYFNRCPSYFAVDATTKQPGFANIFHPYISIFVANEWNGTKKGDWSLQPRLTQIEQEVADYYSKRDKFKRPILSRAKQYFI
jgi:hypothetical protein